MSEFLFECVFVNETARLWFAPSEWPGIVVASSVEPRNLILRIIFLIMTWYSNAFVRVGKFGNFGLDEITVHIY